VQLRAALLSTLPAAFGLGWLYVRRGIESAILCVLAASAFATLFVSVGVRLL
jgi:hypothetical protein